VFEFKRLEVKKLPRVRVDYDTFTAEISAVKVRLPR
jgi:hypothetical protein